MKKISLYFVIIVLVFLFTPFNLPAEEQGTSLDLVPMVIEEGGTGPYKAVATGEDTLTKFTIYRPQNLDDFKRIERVPVIIINFDVGHGGTYAQPHGGAFSDPTIAWLKWQLNGDSKASLMFKGDECGLCTDKEWGIETKNIK